MSKAQQSILYCSVQLLFNQWREERRPLQSSCLSLQICCYLYLRFCLLVRTWVIFWGHPLSTCSNFFRTFSSCAEWTLNCFHCFARWKNLFPCLFISEFLRLPFHFEMRTLLIIEFFILFLSFSHILICMYICMHACMSISRDKSLSVQPGLALNSGSPASALRLLLGTQACTTTPSSKLFLGPFWFSHLISLDHPLLSLGFLDKK